MDDFEHRVHVDSGRVRYPGQEAIARLRAEVESLQVQLQAGESFHAVATQQRDAAWREVEALKAGNYELTDVLLRNGFRRCHNMFCNCGSWHYEGGYRARMNEITEALAEAGYPLSNENGNTPLRALGELVAEVEALRADAEQYRWLRAQHWHDGPMCVVVAPKQSVKLGADCPSEERLDALIYAARAAQGGET